jgi:hypothetical protein
MNTLHTYHLKDIWDSYCLSLMASNEGWVGENGKEVLYKSMYRKYRNKGKLSVIEAITYQKYVEVISMFFELAKEHIINGEVLNLGNKMGKICARRVQRDHRKKAIDYAATSKQTPVWNDAKNKYVKKLIYFTTDDWCRIGWHKMNAITNETVYEFKPTRNLRSGLGFNQQFSSALKKNPILKYKYLYYPLKSVKKNDL